MTPMQSKLYKAAVDNMRREVGSYVKSRPSPVHTHPHNLS